MIILHAGFYNNELLIWGETPAASESGPPPPRGRKPKVPKPRPLIYAAGEAELTQVLADIDGAFRVEKNSFGKILAWIPTVDQLPLASNPLIAPLPESRAEAALAPWQITAVKLPGPALIELLCLGVNRDMFGPGVMAGPDLAFWVKAMRFAGALVAGQKFLPGLQAAGKSYQACWQPVIRGVEAQTQAVLAAAMPHACRALTQEAGAPPETPARRLIVWCVLKNRPQPLE